MSDRKVAICSPIHRTVEADFMVSMIRTLQGFPAACEFFHVVGHANLARARNYLVAQARAWGATDIVFVDSDIGWEAEAFISLFEMPDEVRVNAGCPQRRNAQISFCGIPDTPVARRLGNYVRGPVSGQAATAFLRVSANVFDELEPKVPAFIYQGVSYPAFFEVGIRDGEMLDEDVWFSRLCRDNGIEVWLDPSIQLRHWHSQPLTEVMADHLTYSAPLKEVANG